VEGLYRKISPFLILLIVTCLAACRPVSKKDILLSSGFADSLQAGDIMLRMGRGFSSTYFRNLSISEKRFSHVGIVCKSADSMFIVHALANGQNSHGAVRISSVTQFIKDSRFGAVYRYPFQQSVRNQIAGFALQAARDSLAFDWQFDLDTPNKVYCTELVFQAVNAAVDSTYLTPHLIKRGKQYITLDDTYLRPTPLRQVAWFE